jgi:hypothetical protein
MDMSKLPRLSETQRQQQAEAAAADAPMPEPMRAAAPVPAERVGPDAWISIAIGVLLLLMNSRLWQYFLFRSRFTWTFQDPQGNPLEYPQTVFFWGDLAMVSFAIVLIVEGLVLALARRPAMIAAAMALTVVATLLNLGYVVTMLGTGYGLQFMSALAVAFGVYIAMNQWRMLSYLRPRRTGKTRSI